MIPYYLFSREPRQFDQITAEINRSLTANRHFHDRAPTAPQATGLSELISVGTLRTVNVIEHGWCRMASIFRG